MRRTTRDGLRIAAILISSGLLGAALVFAPGAAEGAKGGGDTTPPVRSDGAPTGTLPGGTTSTDISLKTNEAATCRYSTTPGITYARMKNTFSNTGGLSHSTRVDGLEDGNTYNFYVRCRDLARDENTDDYAITFSVGFAGDCGTPSPNPNGSGSVPSGPFWSAAPAQAGTWKVVPSPNVTPDPTRDFLDNNLRGVDAIAADDVWAVGDLNWYGHFDLLALHWDGREWTVVPTPDGPLPQNRFHGVSGSSASDVWAVGQSYDPSYAVPAQTLIEHWDGTQWSIVPSPSPRGVVNELRAVAAVSANDAWAVGRCASGNYRSSTVILHWDGSGWTRVPSPNPGGLYASNELYAITATAADDVWAVGLTYAGSEGAYAPLALHWDGVAWRAAPTGLNGGGYGSFFWSVSGAPSGEVLAVGASVFDAGLEGGVRHVAFAARWDGIAWTQITDIRVLEPRYFATSSNFYGVSAVAGDLAWVVGEVTGDAWVFHWDGTSLNEVRAPDLPWYNTLYAVDARTTDDAWAVGRFAIEGDPGTKTLTERYSVP